MNIHALRRACSLLVVGALACATFVVAVPSTAFADDSPLTPAKIKAALQNVNSNLAPAMASGQDADIRNDGTIRFATPDAGDIVVTLPGGHTATPGVDGSQEYLNGNSAVVARPTKGGAQTLLIAANKSAPTEYTFGVSNGYVAALPNGGVLLLDRNLHPQRIIPAPWALDARHNTVATSYSVGADHTSFTQTITHTAKGVAYPVVGDPIVVWLLGFTLLLHQGQLRGEEPEGPALVRVGVGPGIGLLANLRSTRSRRHHITNMMTASCK